MCFRLANMCKEHQPEFCDYDDHRAFCDMHGAGCSSYVKHDAPHPVVEIKFNKVEIEGYPVCRYALNKWSGLKDPAPKDLNIQCPMLGFKFSGRRPFELFVYGTTPICGAGFVELDQYENGEPIPHENCIIHHNKNIKES